jgi:hypothetical protein
MDSKNMQLFLQQQEPKDVPKASEEEIKQVIEEKAAHQQRLLEWFNSQPRKIKRQVKGKDSFSNSLREKFRAKMKTKSRTEDDIRGD